MRYLGITLIEHVQELYAKNSKMLMKENKDNLNKRRDITSSWIGILNIMKIQMISKLIYSFIAIPIKISTGVL